MPIRIFPKLLMTKNMPEVKTASVYTKNGYSEGNCTLVGVHNLLTYLRIKGSLSNIPLTTTATILPTSDYFYDQAKLHGYSPRKIATTVLYYELRKYAIEDYGYTVSNTKLPDGSKNTKCISPNNKPEFINKVLKYFGQSVNIITNSAHMTQFTSHIKRDYPILLSLYDDPVYGDHDVVVTGYAVFKKYTTVLGVEVCTQTVNIIRLLNGWSKDIVFYDASASNSMSRIVEFLQKQ